MLPSRNLNTLDVLIKDVTDEPNIVRNGARTPNGPLVSHQKNRTLEIANNNQIGEELNQSLQESLFSDKGLEDTNELHDRPNLKIYTHESLSNSDHKLNHNNSSIMESNHGHAHMQLAEDATSEEIEKFHQAQLEHLASMEHRSKYRNRNIKSEIQ